MYILLITILLYLIYQANKELNYQVNRKKSLDKTLEMLDEDYQNLIKKQEEKRQKYDLKKDEDRE